MVTGIQRLCEARNGKQKIKKSGKIDSSQRATNQTAALFFINNFIINERSNIIPSSPQMEEIEFNTLFFTEQ